MVDKKKVIALKPEHLRAIEKVKARYGRPWRWDLRAMWAGASYPDFDADTAQALQWLRNAHGTTLLEADLVEEVKS